MVAKQSLRASGTQGILCLCAGFIFAASGVWSLHYKHGTSVCSKCRCSWALQTVTVTWLTTEIEYFHSRVLWRELNVSVVLVGSKFDDQVFPSWSLALVTPTLLIEVEETGDCSEWQKNVNTPILFAYGQWGLA